MKKIIRKVKGLLQNLFLRPFLKSINVLPHNGLVTLYDIGAAGGIEPRWKAFTPHLNYVGFEPDERSSKDLLNKTSSQCHSYNILQHAVWDSKTELELNLCASPGASSVYSPNIEFLKNFPQVERFDVVGTETVSVVPMDGLDLTNPDFIKLDIQGGELNALEGADKLLNDVLGLEIEVEFVELYTNQPLFGNVCEFLSKKGFEFIDFVNLCRWERAGFTAVGQCVFGDALFLRPPEKIDYTDISVDKLSAYFSILLIYRRFDLIDTTLSLLPMQEKYKFKDFQKKVAKARRVHNVGRKIAETCSSILAFIGFNYKSHLLY